MKKLLKRIQFIVLYVTLGELLVLGFFFGIYLTNTWDFQNILSLNAMGYITLTIIVVNLVLYWIGLFVIYFNRQRNDLKTGDIIGNDIQASYKFGNIGTVIVDDEGVIIYVSETLKSKGFNILNHNIYAWNPSLFIFNKSSLRHIAK